MNYLFFLYNDDSSEFDLYRYNSTHIFKFPYEDSF